MRTAAFSPMVSAVLYVFAATLAGQIEICLRSVQLSCGKWRYTYIGDLEVFDTVNVEARVDN